MLADLRLDDYTPIPTCLYTPEPYGILMITRAQARKTLHAFTWTNGDTFLEAYNTIHGEYGEQTWTSYIERQFHLMQTKPLDFIIKWPEVAAEIVTIYNTAVKELAKARYG